MQAFVATVVLAAAIGYTYKSYLLISAMFFFDEREAVTFDDILASFRMPFYSSSSKTRLVAPMPLARPSNLGRRRVTMDNNNPATNALSSTQIDEKFAHP